MYKLFPINPQTGKSVDSVFRTSDGASIPFDPANNDYVDYLKWLEEGNEPLPADPLPESPKPTVEDLQAQLAAIQAQLAELSK
jgi:hypothetical protein